MRRVCFDPADNTRTYDTGTGAEATLKWMDSIKSSALCEQVQTFF